MAVKQKQLKNTCKFSLLAVTCVNELGLIIRVRGIVCDVCPLCLLYTSLRDTRVGVSSSTELSSLPRV